MLPPVSDDLDTRVTHFFVRRWGRNVTFDAAVATIAEWTPIIMVGLIAMAAFGLGLHPDVHRAAANHGLAAISAAVAARIVNEPIGRLFGRSRPFQDVLFRPLVEHESGDSFPSNHATGAFALAVVMLNISGYGPLLFTLACALSFARVYVGLHHVSDVVVGAIHGTAAALISLAVLPSVHISSLIRAW